MKYDLVVNEYGFLSVAPLPTQKMLEDHYRDTYFQAQHGSYQKKYTEDEITYFENESRIAEFIFKRVLSLDSGKLLDVGAGEGFFSKYFSGQRWNVTCCDFSSHGIESQNPELLANHIQGDISDIIQNLSSQEEQYNLINLKNVLEHVIDPIVTLKSLSDLMSKKSLLRIVVPNDYSNFQSMLLDRNHTENTWFCPPEHLHYFNFDTLSSLLVDLDFSIESVLSDFPIELFLLNEHSNYSKEPSKGKAAHMSRIAADRFLFDQGMEKYIDYYSSSAKIGFGRQIIIYASKKSSLPT